MRSARLCGPSVLSVLSEQLVQCLAAPCRGRAPPGRAHHAPQRTRGADNIAAVSAATRLAACLPVCVCMCTRGGPPRMCPQTRTHHKRSKRLHKFDDVAPLSELRSAHLSAAAARYDFPLGKGANPTTPLPPRPPTHPPVAHLAPRNAHVAWPFTVTVLRQHRRQPPTPTALQPWQPAHLRSGRWLSWRRCTSPPRR